MKTVAEAKAKRAELVAKILDLRNRSYYGIQDMADGTTPAMAKAITDGNIRRYSAELRNVDRFLSEYAEARKAAACKREWLNFNKGGSVLPANFRLA